MFSIRVKQLFEPVVLRRKPDGFLVFFKAFSQETDLWVTLGDFTVKKVKSGREICNLTENRLSRNKMWCKADNHNLSDARWFYGKNSKIGKGNLYITENR